MKYWNIYKMTRYKMDVKVSLFKLLVICILFQGNRVETALNVTSAVLSATGADNGLSTLVEFSGPTSVICLIDGGDNEEVDAIEVSDTPVETTFTTNGYFNISLSVIGDNELYVKTEKNLYIGTSITEVDVSNNVSGFIIPIIAPLTAAVIFDVSFLTGTDVDITVSLPHNSWEYQESSVSNGTHSISIDQSNFPTSGLYTVQVNLTSPLHLSGIVAYSVLAIQEPLAVTSVSLKDYPVGTTPIYVMVGQEFKVEVQLTGGEDLTFSLTIEQGDTTVDITGNHCTGPVTSNEVGYTFASAGSYNITVDISNYVSNYTETINVEVIHKVNEFSIDITPTTLLSTDTVTYTASVASSASLPMGDVICNVTLDDDTVQGSMQFDMSPLDYSSLSKTTDTTILSYVEGWYIVTVNCTNQLPYEINAIKTYNSVKQVVKVANPVNSLQLIDDSDDHLHHPFTIPIIFTVQLTNPGSDLPNANLTCEFNTDSSGTGDIESVEGDVTSSSSITFEKVFKGGRDYTVSVKCSNLMETQELTIPETFTIYFNCWVPETYFDSVYKTPAGALTSKTNEDMKITSNVGLTRSCNGTPHHFWTLYKVDGNVETFYRNLTSLSTTLLNIARFEIPHGLFKLELTTYFTGFDPQPQPMLSDIVYVNKTLPALMPLIRVDENDNDMKIVIYTTSVVIDSSLSTDPGDSNLDPDPALLTRTWACRTGSGLDQVKVQNFMSSEDLSIWPVEADEDCSTLLQQGAVEFTIPANSLKLQWYLFTLTVTDSFSSRVSKRVQAIEASDKPSLQLALSCLSNCENGTGNSFILVTTDLQLNVQVETPGVQNSTFHYLKEFKMYDPISGEFVDKSEYIEDTSDTGFKIAKETLDDLPGKKYMVTFTVSAVGFKATPISRTYNMNVPPKYGTSVLNPIAGTVVASITEICAYNADWIDEDERSTVQYALVQVFLTETNEVNKSIPANVQAYSELTTQCIKLMKSPVVTVTKTRVQVRIRDRLLLPYTTVDVGDIEIEPAVANDATGEEGALKIEQMLQSNQAALQSATELKSLGETSALIAVLSNALLIDTVQEQPIAADDTNPGTGGFILATDDNGKPVSASEVIDSLAKKVLDPTLAKCQQVMLDLTSTLLNTTKAQSTETKQSATSQIEVVGAVTSLAEGKKHLTEDSLSLMMDVVDGLLTSTTGIDTNSAAGGDFLHGVVRMSGKVAKAMQPDDLSGSQSGVSLEKERARSQMLALFATQETNIKVEQALIGPDETYFTKTVLAIRQEANVKKRKGLCNSYSKRTAIYQANLVRDAKMSDGSDTKIGTDGSNVVMTRDTSANLATKTLNTTKSSAKLPGLANKQYAKATVAIFEQEAIAHIDESAGALTSRESTLVIDIEGEVAGNVKLTQKIEQVAMQSVELFKDSDDASGFTYFQTYVSNTFDDLNFNIKPDLESGFSALKFEIYILYVENADLVETLFVSKMTYTHKKECEAANCVVQFRPKERGANSGLYKVGVAPITEDGNTTASRRKRSAFLNKNETIQFATATMACMTWDDNTDSWRSDECTGTWKPDTGELDCECKPKKELTFANSFYVAPNKIDFGSVFLKFSPLNQAAVMATLILIFLIYIVIVIWARRQDRKDLLKWGITPLSDNFSEDNYFYVIKVFTGMRPGAGTRSRVCMVICGEEMDSGVRELYDGVRDEFSTGSVMNFLMSTTVYLGDLDYIRIWHDNSGGCSYASWYLSRMEVHDVQRNESFSFLGERWLAVEKEDGQLECVLPVCKSENLNVFKNRFFLNAKDNLAESHLWISVAYRPQASNFTRTQRASCALLFVMLTMIANAMFFKGSNEDNYETPAELQVGPFRFSLQQIYISFVCALIVTPGTLLVIYLFKLAKVKLDPNATIFKSNDKSSRYKIPFMNNWLENEQRRSMELEKHLVQKGIPNSQGFALPHWCRNLAWFIVVATSFICAFFIMLFSMQWGKQKSEEWITTFLLSFFESVFCLDPVKVGIMALVLAILFRSTKEGQAPVNRSTIMKRYSSSLRGKSKGIRLPAPPLDHKKLEKARDERRRDMLMRKAFRDIVVNIIIIWILFSISFSNRDIRSYYMHKEVVNRLLEPIDMPSFSAIKTTNDFFDWLNKTAIINAFPEYEKDANSTPLHWRVRQFTEGGSHFRVGPPRLRQLRTTKKSCTNSPYPTEDCFKRYSETSEETKSYCIGWKDGPCDPDEELYQYSSEAWKFTSAFDIWGLPISGYYTTYGGGGYISKLSVNREVSQDILAELYQNSWVDRQTRAVLFEFTLYCLNANIFTYNMFMVEFPETGGAMPYYIIFPMRVYLHQGPLGLYTLACEVLFVLYLIILTVMIIMQIVQQKKAFFKQGWQVYDLVFIILAYVAIFMNIVQVVFTDMSLDIFREDKKAFVNFYHLAIWNTVLVLLIGLLVFMATLRMLNVLGYNKRIGAVAKVFTKAASDLVWFGLFFSYVFTCYAAFGYLLFGWKLKSYKTVFSTMGTLFISMIGKSRFTEIEETDPVFSKVYFMCFIFFVVYMILTMFLAVLSKAIDQVHEDTKRDKSEEMVEYVIRKLKGLLSYGGSTKKGSVKPAPWNRQPSTWSRKHGRDQFSKATNREILQEIRETMNEALTVDPRDFSTPDAEHSKRQVKKFRR